MRVVDIRRAKANLSKLVAEAARGESFIIARGGKPLVKVVPAKAPSPIYSRGLGFLSGQLKVPDDFDRMNAEETSRLFGTTC